MIIPPTQTPPITMSAISSHFLCVGTCLVISLVIVVILGIESTLTLQTVSIRYRSRYLVCHLSVPCSVTTTESRMMHVSTLSLVCISVS